MRDNFNIQSPLCISLACFSVIPTPTFLIQSQHLEPYVNLCSYVNNQVSHNLEPVQAKCYLIALYSYCNNRRQ